MIKTFSFFQIPHSLWAETASTNHLELDFLLQSPLFRHRNASSEISFGPKPPQTRFEVWGREEPHTDLRVCWESSGTVVSVVS